MTWEQERRGSPESKLLPFILRTFPQYRPGWFHRSLCLELDKFLADVIAKRSPRLALSAPPQHGKSEIISRRFPAFAFGPNPDLRVIGTSYSGDRATDFSRDVQRIIDNESYHRIFPTTTISGQFNRDRNYKRESDLFEIIDHRGRYRAAGVGGGITGEPADILIIDDPIKDFAESISSTIRESVWNWMWSTAFSRVQEGGGIIIMSTRWHQDDPIGRLLDRQPEKWRYINYPAIAETLDDEIEGVRKLGEPLSPERYTLKTLTDIRDGGGMSKYQWSALYQGRPSPEGGGIFKRDDWQFFKQAPDTFDEVIQSWDCAFKDTDGSDFVCGGVIGVKGPNKYVLDLINHRLTFRGTKQAIKTMSGKWPAAYSKLVEDKANGSAVINDLNSEIAGFIAIEPEGGKLARAHAVSGETEARNVYLPDPQHNDAPWVHDFIEQTAGFPTAPHDDQVDMFTQALSYLRKRQWGMFDLWRAQAGEIRSRSAKPAIESTTETERSLAEAQRTDAINNKGMHKLNSAKNLAKPVISTQAPKCPQCSNQLLTRLGDRLRCNPCGWVGQVDDKGELKK